MQVGMIGLGKMGLNLALNMQEHGHDVLGWNRSAEKREQAKQSGLQVVENLSDLLNSLNAEQPRVLWLMVAAGDAIDEIIFGEQGLVQNLKSGDIVIDGANSHYKDSQRRAERCAATGVNFVDVGVSGGIEGARRGACVMIGGDENIVNSLNPLFTSIAVPEGSAYFGPSGAGHFVKMVHNAIEYGMMEAISEGMNLLNSFEPKLDLAKAANVWSHGSIIESRLIKTLHQGLQQDSSLQNIPAEVGSLGTGKWAVEEALARGIPFTTIAQAVFNRFQSQDRSGFAYKLLQDMRANFGGHDSNQDLPA